jgi:uncharacterized SAM-binding protein YcdF (DUF218 family)
MESLFRTFAIVGSCLRHNLLCPSTGVRFRPFSPADNLWLCRPSRWGESDVRLPSCAPSNAELLRPLERLEKRTAAMTGKAGGDPYVSSAASKRSSKSGVALSSLRFPALVVRKECWSLSWPGRTAVALVILTAGCLIVLRVYPFLSVTDRTNAKILVVEGWVHQYAIRAGMKEFQSGSYQRVFTTGGPVIGSGGYVNDYQTSASVGADLLKKYGLADEFVQMVPSRVLDRDRTYASAVALRRWFQEHHMAEPNINVLTEDVHSRRTRLLFQEAFGKNTKVGIIAVSNPDYDRKHWWRYSQGVKDVVSEGIAYLYAKFFFYPSESSPDEKTLAHFTDSKS